ncbi:nucleoside-diphosphate sugar epimerase/dehydratase [Motilimonas pumila]|uniref:nucleoside-diphosphate sugar epimerase/dehydratase n=1 Tax=Motilimonas pumila TaxID=2303987 RepID=UPI001E571128|nr:nucleoside-diphosphate sugar epimerase/dehydratase [Motilimonas pumila]
MLSLYLALALRLETTQLEIEITTEEVATIFVTIFITLTCFIKMGLYRAILRYMAGHAVTTIATGVALSTIILTTSSFYFQSFIPRSVPLIYGFVAFIILGAPRLIIRGLVHKQIQRYKPAVIIYGAGQSGYQLAHSLFSGAEYRPIAFIDDNPKKQGSIVHGLRVYPRTHLEQLIRARKVVKVLLALGETSRSTRHQVLLELEDCSAQVQSMPSMQDISSGKAKVSELQDIKIEDLLGRIPVTPDYQLLSSCIKHKVVMVTGAGGSIGSELCRQIIKQKPAKLILLELNEFALYSIEKELKLSIENSDIETELVPLLGSVQRQRRLEIIMKSQQVETVYHAAAYKHVPLVEANIVEGVRNNVFGTSRCARAAIITKVKNFVLVSTDKAVRPTNIMGASKRMAELTLQAMAQEEHSTIFSMVRFGNVLGSSGSVVPLFRDQIKKGGPVTVTHPDIIRYFMTIPEAAQLVIQAGSLAKGGDVFVLDMGQPVKIADLAERMIKLSGLEVKNKDEPFGDIEIKYTGLRPGEKLFEELLIGENVSGTVHPSIMTADEEFVDWPTMQKMLSPLDESCREYLYDDIFQALLNAPINFRPENSHYVTDTHEADTTYLKLVK